MNRRNFLKALGIVPAGALVASLPIRETGAKKFTVRPLPKDFDLGNTIRYNIIVENQTVHSAILKVRAVAE